MKYTVKSPLRHDDKDYKVGSQVELKDEQAEPLISSGVVEKPAEPKKDEKK